MTNIQFTTFTGLKDFQKVGYVSANLFQIANQNILDDYVPSFFLPSNLTSGEILKIFRVDMNEKTGIPTFFDLMNLDMTKLSGNYFQGQKLTTKLVIGKYYAIGSTSQYTSKNIFKCVKGYGNVFSVAETNIGDFQGDYLGDNVGDIFTESY